MTKYQQALKQRVKDIRRYWNINKVQALEFAENEPTFVMWRELDKRFTKKGNAT